MTPPKPPADLQELFACHLRTRLMLRDVMEAEREILGRIVETLATFPEARREELMVASIEGAADGLVYG